MIFKSEKKAKISDLESNYQGVIIKMKVFDF